MTEQLHFTYLHCTTHNVPLYLFFIFLFFLFFNFTILYWFCHISKWIRHRFTCVPHPEPSSLLPPHTIPLGRPSAPAPSIQYHALNLDWLLISYMILYIFQCHSPKSSHPLPLPQSPKTVLYISVSFAVSYTGLFYHLSKFHIYALVYYTEYPLSLNSSVDHSFNWASTMCPVLL